MRLFGYSFFKRTPGQDTNENVYTPLEMMNNISWMAMEKSIRDAFPWFERFKSEKERSVRLFNVIDVFSRLSPKFVLDHFYKSKFDYIWVITEDGQLKIIPSMPEGNNLRPQLLRVSVGRRIYAGGKLRFDSAGRMNVELNSNNFESIDQGWGSASSFQNKNPHLKDFVKTVFKMQSGRDIFSIEGRPSESYGDRPSWANDSNWWEGAGSESESAKSGYNSKTRDEYTKERVDEFFNEFFGKDNPFSSKGKSFLIICTKGRFTIEST